LLGLFLKKRKNRPAGDIIGIIVFGSRWTMATLNATYSHLEKGVQIQIQIPNVKSFGELEAT
jgi:hypothetical protein